MGQLSIPEERAEAVRQEMSGGFCFFYIRELREQGVRWNFRIEGKGPLLKEKDILRPISIWERQGSHCFGFTPFLFQFQQTNRSRDYGI